METSVELALTYLATACLWFEGFAWVRGGVFQSYVGVRLFKKYELGQLLADAILLKAMAVSKSKEQENFTSFPLITVGTSSVFCPAS